MNDEFKWIEDIERGTTSLTGIIRSSRWMDETLKKRERGSRISIGVLVGTSAVLTAMFFVAMADSTRDTKRIMLILWAVVILIFAAMLGVITYIMISKPRKRFKRALAKSYPGLDTSSEASIKSYVWQLAGDPHRFLSNLYNLICWEGSARELQGFSSKPVLSSSNAGDGFESSSIYSPTETVILQTWRTNSIAQELEDLDEFHGFEIGYLEDAIKSYRTIGANEEADLWSAVLTHFKEIERRCALDENYTSDDYFADEAMENQMAEIAEQLDACRPETESKLRDFALQHRAEFSFG